MLIDEQLTPQIQLMRQRVQALYQQGGTLSQQNDVLSAAFEELELALEQLQIVEAQQRRKHEEWLNERAALEIESQSFQYLFENTPAGYIVTSLDGTIRKANSVAAKLLKCFERHLIGRSLALFVPEGQRREFRAQMAEFSEADGIQEKALTMLSWEHTSFQVGATVVAVRGKTGGRPTALHWLLRDITEQGQALPALQERAVGMEPIAHGIAAQARGAGNLAQTPQAGALARKRFSFLAKASVQLMLAQDLDATVGNIAHLAVPDLADACIIDLGDRQSESIQRLVVAREPKTQDLVRTWRRSFIPEKHASDGKAAQPWQLPADTRQPGSADVSKREELQTILGGLEPASAVIAPLQCGDRQIGSLTLLMSKIRRQYEPEDAALIEELARQMSHAVARLRR